MSPSRESERLAAFLRDRILEDEAVFAAQGPTFLAARGEVWCAMRRLHVDLALRYGWFGRRFLRKWARPYADSGVSR